jgi:hypothetical protein
MEDRSAREARRSKDAGLHRIGVIGRPLGICSKAA